MIAAVHVRSLCVAVAAAIVFAFAVPAKAQQPTANALAQAKELVDILGAAREFESLPTAVIVRTAGTFLQSNPALAKDLNEIAENLVTEYYARRSEIPNEIVRLYATRFTEAELKDLIVFYKSALGKKLLTESQYVINEAVKRADAWAVKFRDEVAVRIREELKKRGHNL
jgi:hypothetical protein